MNQSGNIEFALHCLKCHYNFGYYLGFLPYKIRRDTLTGFYQIETSLFRKVLAGSIQVSCAVNYLYILRNLQINPDKLSPDYFQMALFISVVNYSICSILTYFKSSSALCDLFTQVGESRFSKSYVPLSLMQKSIGLIISISWLIFTVSDSIVALEINDWDFVSSVVYLWRGAAGKVSELNSSPLSWPIAIFQILAYRFSYLVFWYAEIYLGIIVYLYWEICNLFYTSIPELSHDVVLDQFQILKVRVQIINSLVGYILLGLCFEAVPFISSQFGGILYVYDIIWTDKVRTLMLIALIVIPMFIAAYTNSKIHRLEDWIKNSYNYNKITFRNLQVVLHDCKSYSCGLKAGGHMFTISYGFLGSALIVILGYVVLVLKDDVQK